MLCYYYNVSIKNTFFNFPLMTCYITLRQNSIPCLTQVFFVPCLSHRWLTKGLHIYNFLLNTLKKCAITWPFLRDPHTFTLA